MKTLNSHFKRKLAQYFKDRLGMWDYNRGWLKGTCPNCGKQKKYGVNLGRNTTNCFRCNYNPRPLQVVIDLEPDILDENEAKLYLNTFDGADYLETPLEFLQEVDAKLPEGYTLLGLGSGTLGDRARKYMEGRGFDQMELMMKGVGYCKGKSRYWGRIIIPFYEAGKLVYFNARQFMGGGKKFDNPKVDELGVGKTMLIYNVDALAMYDTIVVVESATNALTIGDNAIGGGGKVFSNYQISKILSSPCRRVIIVLDPDAWKEAMDLALKLVGNKKVKLVKLPDKLYIKSKAKAIKKVDVNEIGRELTYKYIKESRWVNYSDIMTMKFDYERAKHTYYQG